MGHGQCGPGKGELGVSQYKTGVLTYFPVVALIQVGMMVPSAAPPPGGVVLQSRRHKKAKSCRDSGPWPTHSKKDALGQSQTL